jgi:hypothetical protein
MKALLNHKDQATETLTKELGKRTAGKAVGEEGMSKLLKKRFKWLPGSLQKYLSGKVERGFERFVIDPTSEEARKLVEDWGGESARKKNVIQR